MKYRFFRKLFTKIRSMAGSRVDGYSLFPPAIVMRNAYYTGPGFIFPPFVFLNRSHGDAVKAHELFHIMQFYTVTLMSYTIASVVQAFVPFFGFFVFLAIMLAGYHFAFVRNRFRMEVAAYAQQVRHGGSFNVAVSHLNSDLYNFPYKRSEIESALKRKVEQKWLGVLPPLW